MMAKYLLILLLAVTLLTEPVMMELLMDSGQKEPAGVDSDRNLTAPSSGIVDGSINTVETRPFEVIVQFEKLLAEEKDKLLSPFVYFNNHEVDNSMKSPFSDNSRTVTKCLSNIDNIIKAARKRLPWALDMMDSTGKPSSGILRGNNLFVGDFDQCMDVATGQNFEGQYCTTRVVISKIHNATLSPHLQFLLGLCFPSSCESIDVERYINAYFQSHPDFSARAMLTNCQDRHLSLTTKAKVVICVCSIFVAFLAIGTFYDVVYKRWWLEEKRRQYTSSQDQNGHGASSSANLGSHPRKSEHQPIIDPELQKPKLYASNATVESNKSSTFYDTCDKVLMSFSVYTNTTKLFTVSQSQESIDCIHGMRFISMTWIILLHTYGMSPGTRDNIVPFMYESNGDWTFMPMIKSVSAVDTFFAMSGLLMTYLVIKQLNKEEVTPKFFGIFYLHRYLRLTPPYMLILMTYVPLFKYLSDGPFWPQDGIEIDECEDTWWTNLLYINNIGVSYKKMCMGWSWYLACDFQFHVVSPLMFLPMFLYEWKGLVVPLAFLLGNAICSGVISNAKNLITAMSPFAIQYLQLYEQKKMEGGENDYQTYYNHMKYYYIKPYTRIGPFIIGMMAGFLLFKSERKARMSKPVVVLGWMAATAIALAVQYGLYDHVRYEDRLSEDVRALYNALNSIAWGVSVCWVIFACANGYGGIVNTLLSWKPLIPLSRLTYCAYLVHPLVIQFYFYSQRKPFYINNLNVSFAFVAMTVLSYTVAYIAYMAYEVPIVGLEKIVRGHGKRK